MSSLLITRLEEIGLATLIRNSYHYYYPNLLLNTNLTSKEEQGYKKGTPANQRANIVP